MKANELRLGNHVLNENKHEVVFQLVTELNGEYLVIEGINNTPEHEITPIQLTEEWLLKFGFEKCINSVTHWFKKQISPSVYLGIDIIGATSITEEFQNEFICLVFLPNKVQYVHQIQNLYFLLTGEELEINE